MKNILLFWVAFLLTLSMQAQFFRNKILIEEGTATWCVACGTVAQYLEQMIAEGDEIAVVAYHSLDEYSNSYGDARIEYYNIVGLPHVEFEGVQLFDLSYESLLAEYESRIVESTHYSIGIDVVRDGTNVNASVNVGQIGAPNPETKVLHLVLTESHIPETWYGGDEVNHVQRLMIPDEHGTPITSGKNAMTTFNFDFEMEPDWLTQNCQLIAFIQDTLSKVVVQTQVFPLLSTVFYSDARLNQIQNPDGAYCLETISPIIEIENYGADTLLNCLINYELNGITGEYNWTGSLGTYQIETVTLPEIAFTLLDNNMFSAEITLPNGEVDENPSNNALDKSFGIAPLISQPPMVLELKTDSLAIETSWQITNSQGNIVQQGDSYSNNTLYTITLNPGLSDCYTFTIFDEGSNGICCANGAGYFRLSDNNGLIYKVGGSFESLDQFMFQLDYETDTKNYVHEIPLNIFPNPANEVLFIENASNTSITLFDQLQKLVFTREIHSNKYRLNTAFLNPGIYFLLIERERFADVRKIVIMR